MYDSEDVRQGDYFFCYMAYLEGLEAAQVLKWPLYNTMQTQTACLIALRKAKRARRVAAAYNEAVASFAFPDGKPAQEVSFVNTLTVQLPARTAAAEGSAHGAQQHQHQGRAGSGDASSQEEAPWALCEPDLEDTPAHRDNTATLLDYFCLFNDAFGGVVGEEDMDPGDESEDTTWVERFQRLNATAQSLSCFSYFHSKQACLLIKVQGVGTTYTNPDFHFSNGQDPYFSPNNQGQEGIANFFKSHQHNELCRHALKTLPDFSDEWLSPDFVGSS